MSGGRHAGAIWQLSNMGKPFEVIGLGRGRFVYLAQMGQSVGIMKHYVRTQVLLLDVRAPTGVFTILPNRAL